MTRREYSLDLTVNGVAVKRVVIDPHFEEKHSESVNDEIILRLVKKLDGKQFQPDAVMESGFLYFVNDDMKLEGKHYKLIWLMKKDEIFIGVVNCFRRD